VGFVCVGCHRCAWRLEGGVWGDEVAEFDTFDMPTYRYQPGSMSALAIMRQMDPSGPADVMFVEFLENVAVVKALNCTLRLRWI
jgi:hypothetical protein